MPIVQAQNLEFLSHSPDQTQRIGVRLGEGLLGGDLICLTGDLGTGKTTLAQGIARGWGSFDQVTSPSFVLVNEYRRADGSTLYHMDAFRLEGAQEALFIGLDDLLSGRAPVLIEWPERMLEALPEERMWISLRWVDELRRGMLFEATGIRYEKMLDAFRHSAFGG